MQSSMRAMTKSELAERAGVSLNTLNRWCKPFRQELEGMGVTRKQRLLPPMAVKLIAEKLCIDL